MPAGAKHQGTRDLKSPEGTVSGYLTVPETGSGPGVLVLHAWWGLNEFFKGLCDRLATAGFVAFAPDLYRGPIASTIAEAEKLMPTLSPERARADLAKSLAGLKAHPGVRGKRIGVMGFSMGAYWALRLAEELPSDFAAIVVFYGTGDGNYANTKAPLLGHFAETDEYEPAASVREFEKLVRAGGRDAAIHTYPGTSHWFFENDRPDAYDARAAGLAWERTIQFLTTHLPGKVT